MSDDDTDSTSRGLQDQIDQLRADITRNRADIDDLRDHGDIDRKMIEELQADGVLAAEHARQVEQLGRALASSRRIGAAIGIVMHAVKVDELHAFAVLVRASQNQNRKLRDIADDLVATGDVAGLLG